MSAKILTVDSGADVRHLIEIRLKQAGYQVRTAANGNDCYRLLTMLAGHHPPVYNSDTHDPHLPANGSDSLDKSLQDLLAEIIPPDLQALVSNNSLSGLNAEARRQLATTLAQRRNKVTRAPFLYVADPRTDLPEQLQAHLAETLPGCDDVVINGWLGE